MANRYTTADELKEVESSISESIRLLKSILISQQQEINLIAQSLEQLQKEVVELNGGRE